MTAKAWRVLLIDDSEVSLHFATAVLERDGFEVRSTSNVNEFSSVLDSWRPDIILSDVNMPEISGSALCERLKSLYDTSDIPVILFSGLAEEDLAALAEECGADGALTKRNGLDGLAAELRLLCESFEW